jgi:phi LC3 family holin
MNINWKVRFKNPTFWVQIVVAVVVPILAYLGMSWDDMTTWSALGNIFVEAVKNPVIIVSVIVSVWNAINDPTTTGLSDSTQAMSYTKPSNK